MKLRTNALIGCLLVGSVAVMALLSAINTGPNADASTAATCATP